MNCVGNKGTSLECPVVEDNVEFGFGASAFGSIVIPENCIVAANSTVLNSFEKGTLMIAGSPAIMKRKGNVV